MNGIEAAGFTGVDAGAKRDRFSDLSSESFVKIIFAELGQQDPLQPSDSKAMLEQLSSLRSIQSNIDLTAKLENIVLQNELSGAASMIGKYVSGLSTEDRRVEGAVVSVSRTRDGAILNLHDGARVPMKRVDEMIALPGGAS